MLYVAVINVCMTEHNNINNERDATEWKGFKKPAIELSNGI